MDVALAIELLVPAAEYFGSVTDNSEEAYDALQWNDQRDKPDWTELVEAFDNTPVPVPKSVTPQQAKIALHRAGLLQSVQPAIDQLDEPYRTEAQIKWDSAQEIKRDSPFVVMLGAALLLSDEQIDALFIEAGTVD